METRQKSVSSADGTRLTAYECGREGAPALVLCNGLGGNIVAWRHLIDFFGDRFRLVSWDYRGLYRSSRPAEWTEDASYAMPKHCEDLDAVLAAMDVSGPVPFIGWSMGVQVILEYWRRQPERFNGMMLLNGTAGRPLETAFGGTRWLETVAPHFIKFLEHSAPVLAKVGPYAAQTRSLVGLIKATGLVAPTLDEDVFIDIAVDFVKLDFSAYSRCFRELARHDATPALPTVKVPVLVITGDRDLFTPVETARNLASAIPDAELEVVSGGSHYTPVEYPMVVHLRIEKFLKDRMGLQ